MPVPPEQRATRTLRRGRIRQRPLIAMALIALVLAVYTVGNTDHSSASLRESTTANLISVQTASIKAVSALPAPPTVQYSAGVTGKTGSLTVTNTGTVDAAYRTVTTATGAATLTRGVKVWMWPSTAATGCLTAAANAVSGSWASFPALTGTLAPGGSQFYCVKTALETPVGHASNTAVTAVFSTTLSHNSWTSAASSTVTQTFVDAAPAAPTNLTFSGTTSASTTVNWAASTDDVGVTGYDVYRDGVLIGSTTGATSFIATGLTASTSYIFTVKARDGAGNVSTSSPATTVKTVAVSAPSGWFQLINTQSQMCIDASGSGTTNFTPLVQKTCSSPAATNQQWSFSGPNSAGYYTVVPRHTTSVIWDVESASNDNAAKIILYGPNSGTNQQWSVIAVGADKYQFVARNSGKCMAVIGGATTANAGYEQVTCNPADPAQTFSLRQAAVPDTSAPTAPTNLTASASTSTSVALNWTAATDNVGVTGYLVYRDGVQIGTTSQSVRTFTDSTVTANVTYTYTVRARDAAGNVSGPSNSATVTVPALLTCASSTWEAVYNWTTPTGVDLGTLKYNLYVGGVKVSNVADGWNSYVRLNSLTVPTTIPNGLSSVVVKRILPSGAETTIGVGTVNIQYYQTTTDRTFMCG